MCGPRSVFGAFGGKYDSARDEPIWPPSAEPAICFRFMLPILSEILSNQLRSGTPAPDTVKGRPVLDRPPALSGAMIFSIPAGLRMPSDATALKLSAALKPGAGCGIGPDMADGDSAAPDLSQTDEMGVAPEPR